MPDSKRVEGRCPACGHDSLFLGDGGYVTCSIAECRDPSAAYELLKNSRSVSRILRGSVGRLVEMKRQADELSEDVAVVRSLFGTPHPPESVAAEVPNED